MSNQEYTPAALKLDKELLEPALEILNNSKEPQTVISEDLFKNYFLPCFAGKEPFQEKLGQWLQIAGGVHNPVRVVDGSHNPLFDVPAYYSVDTFAIDGQKNNRTVDIRALMTTVERYNSVNPVKANEIMQDGFHKLALELVDTSIAHSIQDQWKAIFDRYGIESKAQDVASGSKKGTSEEVVDFDPL